MPTIDYPTGVITVAESELTLVQSTPTVVYNYSMDTFWRALRDLEDEEEGRSWPRSCDYNQPVTVGGIQLAAVFTITDYYTVTFEDGQYAVNLTGANTNVQDRVNVNQVSIRAGNSAGLIQTEELRFSAYQNKVTLDQFNTTGKATAGQAYPIGTLQAPVDNWADALFIKNFVGLDTVGIKGNMTISGTDPHVDNIIVEGDSAVKHTVVLADAALITNTIFRNLTITGALDGGNNLSDCIVSDLNYIDGSLRDCLLVGTVALNGQQANFLRCGSGIAGGGAGQFARIDMGGGGTDLVVRDYQGGLDLINCSDPNTDISIDMSSGRVVLEDTITEGNFVIRGIADVEDNSGPNANIDDMTINRQVKDILRLLGADPDLPLTITKTGIQVGDINIAITGDGENISVLTRQP